MKPLFTDMPFGEAEEEEAVERGGDVEARAAANVGRLGDVALCCTEALPTAGGVAIATLVRPARETKIVEEER